ncbi:MAG: ribonuclease HII [Candidatus Taylorbacteria bacterium CG10_big_fil_rev_8_21_14_0_10_41_48]|uniref:Ribonuclease HII n=1 Tax=Candidatus Taylorbacteria bacterium CG10_big_fil_rev_8_21_14_0_10_41_48 TaxID=1975024 RepID=A0A2M8LCF8_9BACT|nr:MAG: ribonuclease HII [Candidatus Taylorbacteria bacterium CG10_big_fil_rev_8_21_14_0_10_41_48]
MSIKNIIGIDEVGRGPLAGPVTLCACMVTSDFDFSLFDGIKDSKKLTEKKREEWYVKISDFKAKKILDFACASVSANEIDRVGISRAIDEAIRLCLEGLKVENDLVEVRLDGALKAPKQFSNQRTIIKGDEKEPIISAASIVAKVIRDGYMTEISATYPAYGFDRHKGYGTASHIRAIKQDGVSPIHRISFLKNIISVKI